MTKDTFVLWHFHIIWYKLGDSECRVCQHLVWLLSSNEIEIKLKTKFLLFFNFVALFSNENQLSTNLNAGNKERKQLQLPRYTIHQIQTLVWLIGKTAQTVQQLLDIITGQSRVHFLLLWRGFTSNIFSIPLSLKDRLHR